MKRSDLLFLVFIAALFAPFMFFDRLYNLYNEFNTAHGYITSFIKFAVLATAGELLGLRIRTGHYFEAGFGVIPRAIVWGLLGLAIKAAFVIFSSGVPAVLVTLGIETAPKLVTAFSISFFMNLIFAPVMMTLHKVTDTHILLTGGTVAGLLKRMDTGAILGSINWNRHWGFVLKKTIPLFWIPAHTITFLLPPSFQVLFAALLGIVLGVILAFSARVKSDL
jgi:hypothetical protein